MIRDLLHKKCPYKDFDPNPYPLDLKGWGSQEPIFTKLLEEVKPRLIVEIGTWKGASAIRMMEESERLGLDNHIICVDTWAGAAEFWTDLNDSERHGALRLKDGHPTVYYQFLANVLKCGMQDRITPFPVSSLVAAEVLRHRSVAADLIYVDGSHSFEDVFLDLTTWWQNLRVGGVMFGDDYSNAWSNVRNAVDTFCDLNGLIAEVQGRHWVLQKWGEVFSLEQLLQ